jgi:hypothetical protein
VELEDELETEAEKKARHVSLYIVHTSMLVVSLGTWITILLTSSYRYPNMRFHVMVFLFHASLAHLVIWKFDTVFYVFIRILARFPLTVMHVEFTL